MSEGGREGGGRREKVSEREGRALMGRKIWRGGGSERES